MPQSRDEVTDYQAPVIRIELRLDGSMPAGVATGPGGVTRDFTGWVGLMSAVDALAGGEDDRLIEEDSR